ncbi:DUF4442 domain-containing protein [Brumimicrobium mesophilum]|uniref:DUF4442 domain-containing protein n=1 Tax=Brumimicrobium mesophilum TaxID=392717 RepID=UPI0018FE08D0|nr:DUF4442 domain-containing protein [Brumimicrobium mesophilum]
MKKSKISLKKMRRLLWLLGMFKIPMIAYIRPKLMLLDEHKAQVRIKLKRRTKNHLKSMYIGSLAAGADMAAGLHALYFAEESGVKISFAFKGLKAEFLKRATTDVYFNSDEGQLVKKAFEEAMSTKERVNKWIKVEAKNTNNEIVAVFDMEISVKVQ